MKNINAFVASAVIAFASSTVFAQSTAVQWTVASGGNGHWYRLSMKPLSFEAARQQSAALGGQLVTYSSSAEQNHVWQQVSPVVSPQPFFIGAYQVPNSCEPGCGWRWVTDEPFSYTAWLPGAPNDNVVNGNENAVCINGSNLWNDLAGQLPIAYVTEWSADCNSDGIVDYGQILAGEVADANHNNIPDCCEQGTPCALNAVQWRVADGGNGHWYAVLPDHHLWSDAKIEAEQLGGYLATTTSNAELLIVGTLLPFREPDGGYGDLFIGASRASNTSPWQWVTGEPFEFTAWIQGQPDNGPESLCLEIVGRPEWPNDFGKWNDEVPYAGGGGQVSIIEWSADCNNDGIVDYGQILNGQLIDTNGNGVPDVCEVDPCPGDISGNNAVDGVDLAALLGMWGTSGQGKFDCDIDNDGLVGGSDLAVVLSDWGPCPN